MVKYNCIDLLVKYLCTALWGYMQNVVAISNTFFFFSLSLLSLFMIRLLASQKGFF